MCRGGILLPFKRARIPCQLLYKGQASTAGFVGILVLKPLGLVWPRTEAESPQWPAFVDAHVCPKH